MDFEKIDCGDCPCCDKPMSDLRASLSVVTCKHCSFRVDCTQIKFLRILQDTRKEYLKLKEKK